MRLTYAAAVYRTAHNYSAHAPDVPGCVSTASSYRGMLRMLREAIEGHLECMAADGEPLPAPAMTIDEVIAFEARTLAGLPDEERARGEAAPALEAHFVLVDVEAPDAALASAGQGAAVAAR